MHVSSANIYWKASVNCYEPLWVKVKVKVPTFLKVLTRQSSLRRMHDPVLYVLWQWFKTMPTLALAWKLNVRTYSPLRVSLCRTRKIPCPSTPCCSTRWAASMRDSVPWNHGYSLRWWSTYPSLEDAEVGTASSPLDAASHRRRKRFLRFYWFYKNALLQVFFIFSKFFYFLVAILLTLLNS